MAKVKFFYIKFDFVSLIKLTQTYKSADEFAYLIFQSEITDSNLKNDEYNLVAYVVNKEFKNQAAVPTGAITVEKTKNHSHQDKLLFGNYPWGRTNIQQLVDSDPTGAKIDHILFTPEAFPGNPNYVHYSITTVFKTASASARLTGEVLNPSPPADPVP